MKTFKQWVEQRLAEEDDGNGGAETPDMKAASEKLAQTAGKIVGQTPGKANPKEVAAKSAAEVLENPDTAAGAAKLFAPTTKFSKKMKKSKKK
jgi:hypothetical protein